MTFLGWLGMTLKYCPVRVTLVRARIGPRGLGPKGGILLGTVLPVINFLIGRELMALLGLSLGFDVLPVF